MFQPSLGQNWLTNSSTFSSQNIDMKEILGNFLEYIQFHKIPANVLMREIHPLGLVPYSIIMNALAYQVSSPLVVSYIENMRLRHFILHK